MAEILRSPVEVGSLSLQVLYIPGGCLGFLNHQQYHNVFCRQTCSWVLRWFCSKYPVISAYVTPKKVLLKTSLCLSFVFWWFMFNFYRFYYVCAARFSGMIPNHKRLEQTKNEHIRFPQIHWAVLAFWQSHQLRHGWPDDATVWQKQVEYFKHKYNCHMAKMISNMMAMEKLLDSWLTKLNSFLFEVKMCLAWFTHNSADFKLHRRMCLRHHA